MKNSDKKSHSRYEKGISDGGIFRQDLVPGNTNWMC